MPRFFSNVPRWFFLAVMLAGSALITASSLAYFDFDTLPPFVIEKLPVRFESLWLWSLRVHVAAASLSLPLCLVLMTRWLQRRAALHRWLGRITGVLVLFALVPSGTVLAFDAKGGRVVTAGFLLSGALIVWFMIQGVVTARRRDLASHRRAMHHVVGQMSVAVISRAMLIGLDVTGVDPDLAYVVALWVPVVACALVPELLSIRSGRSIISTLVERIRRRESSSLVGVLVRFRSLFRPVVRLGR